MDNPDIVVEYKRNWLGQILRVSTKILVEPKEDGKNVLTAMEVMAEALKCGES